MRHKMKRPGLAGHGAGSNNIADNSIIDFPARKITCTGCGIRFTPLRHWHRICPTCWAYHRAITGILAARDALQGVGQ